MRGIDHQQADMFSYLSPEQRVRTDHPLRAVRALTDEILEAKSPLFDALYAECGRPSIPPEKLLRALLMLEQVPGEGRITVGGDKGFDTAEFVAECRQMNVTPHVAQNMARAGGSAIDARTTRHTGYAVSQKKRKRIAECFGWMKDIALLRKLKHRGLFKAAWIFTFAAAAYNLVRMRKLIPIPAAA